MWKYLCQYVSNMTAATTVGADVVFSQKVTQIVCYAIRVGGRQNENLAVNRAHSARVNHVEYSFHPNLVVNGLLHWYYTDEVKGN